MKIEDSAEIIGLGGLSGLGGMAGMGGNMVGGNGAFGSPAALAWLLFMETGEMGYYMLHSELKGGFKPLD